jgi:hypothetical protein
VAAERTIRIKVDGDGKGLIVTVRTAEKEVERLGRKVDDANKRFAGAARGAAKFAAAAASLSSATGGLASLGSQLATASGVLVGLPAIVGAGAAAMGTLKLGAEGAKKAFAGLDDSLVPLKAQVSGVFQRGLEPAVASLNRVLPKTAGGFSAIAAQMAGVATAAANTLTLPKNTRDLNGLLDQTAGLMSGVRRAAGPLTQAFIDVVSVGSEGFGGIGDRIAAASERFAGFISAARESGQLRIFLDNGIDAVKGLWQSLKDVGAIVKGVFSGISEGAGGIGASFAPAIKSMREFVESTRGQDFLRGVGKALAEIGDAVGDTLAAGLHAIAPLVGPLAQAFAILASTAAGILVPVLTVLAPLFEAIGNFLSQNEGLVRTLVTTLGGLAAAYLSVHGAIKLVSTATDLWNTVTEIASNKVAGLGTAFAGMGTAARIASLSLGAIGVVASLIGAALALFSGSTSEAEERQEKLAQASKSVAKVLDEENQQLNKRTRASAAAALEESGLLKVVKDHDLSLQDLTDAYLGNNDARIRLNSAIQQHIDALNKEEDAALAAGDANRGADLQTEIESYEDLKGEIDNAIGGRQTESEAIKRQHEATEGSTAATKDSTGAIQDQIAALEELINKQREAAGIVLDQREAERNLQQAIDSAAESIANNGATLDINTQKGRDNQSALDQIADSTFGLVEAQAKNNASTEQLTGTMAHGRDQFIETARHMGLTRDQAIALANQLGLIPGNYVANVQADTGRARAELNGFAGLLNSIFGRTYTVAANVIASVAGDIGHRATGGPVLPGRDYLVGERGIEILRMSGSGTGTVIPHHQTEKMLGGDTIVYVTIDGQQLQGRIDATVRENNRSLKRAASSGTGGAR